MIVSKSFSASSPEGDGWVSSFMQLTKCETSFRYGIKNLGVLPRRS